jgi:SAM-dependent methyltransferase
MVFSKGLTSMTFYEWIKLTLAPFQGTLNKVVRRRLRSVVRSFNFDSLPDLLDIGGRRSPYTIGVPANVTIIDLPQESELQKRFNLGIDKDDTLKLKNQRSNIQRIELGDMTTTTLPDNSFDICVAVEVIEHVEHDDLFVKQTERVLKSGGIFILTTPNGDNPHHRAPSDPKDYRFYTKEHLTSLLNSYFHSVEVDYAVPVGRWYSLSLKSWSLRRPKRTLLSMIGGLVNGIQATRESVKDESIRTAKLIAIARTE